MIKHLSCGAGCSHGRTIDLHCHVITTAVETLVAGHPARAEEPSIRRRTMGEATVAYNSSVMMKQAWPGLTDITRRLADMDAMGVDLQLISPSPNQYHYWADRDLAAQIVAMQNEHIAELVRAHPTRIAGIGMISLQHPDLAVEQLRHMIGELGLIGAEIGTQINGMELSDPAFEPVFRTAEQLGALLFIHPFSCSLGERLAASYLSNVVGNPTETTVALSHLIFGGVFDRYPGLKIAAAHGGGYLPLYMSRGDHAWAARPDAHTMQHKPSHYLRHILFDCLVYTPQAVRALIDAVGIEQVVLGTDYPFDMGFYDIDGLLSGVAGLTAEEQALIRSGNLERTLGLTLQDS